MLTLVETAAAPQRVHPPYRPFAATVRRVLPLGPHLIRVTFTGPDFGLLGTTGLDQRVKIMFPDADGRLGDIGCDDEQTLLAGSWYLRWRDLPASERNPFRTYTVRSARPGRRELDVDMVLHEPTPGQPDGPAAAWLRRARPGDRVVVVGPDSRTSDPTVGCDWRPGAARHLLLAGDETAAPAISNIVEQLPRGVTAQAFIEVQSSADIQDLVPRGRSRVGWLARDAGCETAEGFEAVAPHGLLLRQAVAAWLPRHMSQLAGVVQETPDVLDDIDVDTELLWDSPVDPTTGDSTRGSPGRRPR